MHAEKVFTNITIGTTISNWDEDYSLLGITQNWILTEKKKIINDERQLKH